MTTFLDGPAKGQSLMLQRAPHFLRVVYDSSVTGGKWDALDQLDDRPKAEETVLVYAMEGEPTWMHVRRDRKHGGSGIFRGSTYRFVDPQPSQDVLCSTSLWRAWVAEQVGSPINADGTAGEVVPS